MSYLRVLPRDLFNEADLLKCYGRLWLLTEHSHSSGFREEDAPAFDIVQDEGDGSLTVANLTFLAGAEPCKLWRPLNARSPWPLYLHPVSDPDHEVRVFDEAGNLSAEMLEFIGECGE